MTVWDPNRLASEPTKSNLDRVCRLLRDLYTFTSGNNYLTIQAGIASAQAVPTTFSAGARYTGFGSLHLIASSTVAAGGTDSVTFSGALTSAFNAYLLIGNCLPETDGAELDLRTGSSGASDYSWQVFTAGGTTADTADSEIAISTAGNATGEGVSFMALIFDPSSTTVYKRIVAIEGHASTTGAEGQGLVVGRRLSTNAITDIQVLFSSGQIAAGGNFALYGLAPL